MDKGLIDEFADGFHCTLLCALLCAEVFPIRKLRRNVFVISLNTLAQLLGIIDRDYRLDLIDNVA